MVIIDLVWVIRIYFASLEDGAFSFVLVRGLLRLSWMIKSRTVWLLRAVIIGNLAFSLR
jgi:hypothetical protein